MVVIPQGPPLDLRSSGPNFKVEYVNNSPVIRAGGATYSYWKDLGLPRAMETQIIVAAAGQYRYTSKIVQELFDNVKLSDSYYIISRRGTNRLRQGRVVRTITGNGGPYASVEIAVELEDGTKGKYFNQFHQIQFGGDRNYTVVELGMTADGYQTIRVVANDGVDDLTVTNNSVDQFPNGTTFGEFGTAARGGEDLEDCALPEYYQRMSTHYIATHTLMSRTYMRTRTSRGILEDNWLKGSARLVLLRATDGEHSVNTFVLEQDLMEEADFIQRWNANQMYGQRNQRPDLDILQGDGLWYQTDPSLRYRYTPGMIDYDFICDWIRNWSAGDRLRQQNLEEGHGRLMMGVEAWRVLQKTFNRQQAYQWREEPWKTDAEATSEYKLGIHRYDTVYELMGYKIPIVVMPENDTLWISGRNAPGRPKVSIRSFDMMLMDTGPIRNFDPRSNSMTSESHKCIQAYTIKEPDGSSGMYNKLYLNTKMDPSTRSVKKSGEVASFSNQLICETEMTGGIHLADQYAMSTMSIA